MMRIYSNIILIIGMFLFLPACNHKVAEVSINSQKIVYSDMMRTGYFVKKTYSFCFITKIVLANNRLEFFGDIQGFILLNKKQKKALKTYKQQRVCLVAYSQRYVIQQPDPNKKQYSIFVNGSDIANVQADFRTTIAEICRNHFISHLESELDASLNQLSENRGSFRMRLKQAYSH